MAMSDGTGIEWSNATWNPVTGCTKVSPGCDHCYAETLAERFRGTPGHHYERGFDLTLRPERLDQPLRWRRPRRIFVNSMSDLFHDDIPDEYIARVFAVMARARQHTFQVLTKRHGRMRSLLDADGLRLLWATRDEDTAEALTATLWPLPNVWLGVSVEDQRWADIRIPALLDTSAAVRWISAEPLLGPIQLRPEWIVPELMAFGGNGAVLFPRLAWVVVGGESGSGARPMRPDWARSLRDQCHAAGTAFFFKQWGEFAPARNDEAWQVGTEFWPVWRYGKKRAGRELDGRTWDEYPQAVTA